MDGQKYVRGPEARKLEERHPRIHANNVAGTRRRERCSANKSQFPYSQNGREKLNLGGSVVLRYLSFFGQPFHLSLCI